jgi:4-hydroxybenzoate polyprenyltransferase
MRILDYLFVLRPTLYFAVWTVFLCGVRAARVFGEARIHGGAERFWLLAAAASFTMGSVFIVNQLKDVATDLANDKLYLIARNEIPARRAAIEAGILLAAGLACAAAAGIAALVLCLALFGIGGLAYSYEPLLWKNRPFLGLWVNAAGAFLIFGLGWIALSPFRLPLFRFGLPYVLAVAGVYLLTTIPDEPGDRQAGKVTFVVRYGCRATTLWAMIAVAAALVGGGVNRDPIIGIPALGALPLFALAAARRELRDVLRAVKFGIFLQALTVCAVFPAYLLLLAVVFFGSKLYYRRRFGVDYPSFQT